MSIRKQILELFNVTEEELVISDLAQDAPEGLFNQDSENIIDGLMKFTSGNEKLALQHIDNYINKHGDKLVNKSAIKNARTKLQQAVESKQLNNCLLQTYAESYDTMFEAPYYTTVNDKDANNGLSEYFYDYALTKKEKPKKIFHPANNKYIAKAKKIFTNLLALGVNPALYQAKVMINLGGEAFYRIVDVTPDNKIVMQNVYSIEKDDEGHKIYSTIEITPEELNNQLIVNEKNQKNIEKFNDQYLSLEEIQEIDDRISKGEHFEDIIPEYNGGYEIGSDSLKFRTKVSPERKHGKVITRNSDEIDISKLDTSIDATKKLNTTEDVFNNFDIDPKYINEPFKDKNGNLWHFAGISNFARKQDLSFVPKVRIATVAKDDFDEPLGTLSIDLNELHDWIALYNSNDSLSKNEAYNVSNYKLKHERNGANVKAQLKKYGNKYNYPFGTTKWLIKGYALPGADGIDPESLWLVSWGENTDSNTKRGIDVKLQTVVKSMIMPMIQAGLKDGTWVEKDNKYQMTDDLLAKNTYEYYGDPSKRIKASLNPGSGHKGKGNSDIARHLYTIPGKK